MAQHGQKLEVSVTLPTWCDVPGAPPSWQEMRGLAHQAEAIGVDAIFVADHSGFDRRDGPSTEFWDGWTLLPALAEVTSRVAIGPLVAAPHLRHPVALARMASTLDEVSGGRLILGLGSSAPIERALRVLGIQGERLYSRFAEAIGIIAPLLRNGVVDFEGGHFVAHEAIRGPDGPRGGSIPIWIGARGPRMMSLAARWADAVNFQAALTSAREAESLVSHFEDVCRTVGRDPSSIAKTGWAMLSFVKPDTATADDWEFAVSGDPVRIAEELHAFHRAGVDHVSCYFDPREGPTPARTFPLITPRSLKQFAVVIDTLRQLEARA